MFDDEFDKLYAKHFILYKAAAAILFSLAILVILLFCSVAFAEEVYLGELGGSEYDPESTNNEYGQYGSEYATESINNEFGQYGSEYSIDSPNNEYVPGTVRLYAD